MTDEATPASSDGPVKGTQSVRRALQLLRQVARGNDQGVKLAQLVRDAGLDRGTTYRLMSCLVEEQFVDRDSASLYRLGPEAVLLGSLLPQPTPLLRRFVPVMKRIGRISGDTVFLMMRQGDHVYCAHREEGSSLVKVLTTNVGQQRLIGTGTGGAAVLRYMGAEELAQTHARHAAEYAEWGMDADRLQEMATVVQQTGHAVTYDAIEIGVSGCGMAFRMGNHGMGALSIATLTARFGPERQQMLADLFRRELQSLGLHD